MATRQPTIFLPHGGGPWPWMDSRAFGAPDAMGSLRRWLEALPSTLPAAPSAVLMISAHWEERIPTVSSAARPSMLYDYYGFPPETYQVSWPAPGDPALAARTRALLEKAGFSAGESAGRGFDHGTFVPMAVAWPGAEIPTVQLSLVKGLDPDTHLRMGRALAPLRDEGVLILGSGMSYHNMRGFRTAQGARDSEAFSAWLARILPDEASARDDHLRAWTVAPSGRASHPREEHLLPLMVVAGAAGEERGRITYSDKVLDTRVVAASFG